jgi:hypothetical protein
MTDVLKKAATIQSDSLAMNTFHKKVWGCAFNNIDSADDYQLKEWCHIILNSIQNLILIKYYLK